MIDLYYWPTPNGHKITMFLEETNTPYNIKLINIGKGEQFAPDFLKIAPNNRMPAIVDHQPLDGKDSISMFESGAILLYFAEKLKKLLPQDIRGRTETLQWLFWQMSGLGPMLGQNHHFSYYATEKVPYAIDRYVRETGRLYGVLDKQLQSREFVVGEYSIADIAMYPWIVQWERQQISLNDFPNVKRWFECIAARPATKKAYEKADLANASPTMDDAARKILFGQERNTVK